MFELSVGTSGAYQLHRTLDLKSCMIAQLEGVWIGSHGFQLMSGTKSFIVLTSNEMEQENWFSSIKTNIETLNENKDTTTIAPVWTHDSLATKCNLCSQSFSLLNRRHHCRKCGGIVCSACSEFERLLPNIDLEKPVRVCDSCEKLFKTEEDLYFKVSIKIIDAELPDDKPLSTFICCVCENINTGTTEIIKNETNPFFNSSLEFGVRDLTHASVILILKETSLIRREGKQIGLCELPLGPLAREKWGRKLRLRLTDNEGNYLARGSISFIVNICSPPITNLMTEPIVAITKISERVLEMEVSCVVVHAMLSVFTETISQFCDDANVTSTLGIKMNEFLANDEVVKGFFFFLSFYPKQFISFISFFSKVNTQHFVQNNKDNASINSLVNRISRRSAAIFQLKSTEKEYLNSLEIFMNVYINKIGSRLHFLHFSKSNYSFARITLYYYR